MAYAGRAKCIYLCLNSTTVRGRIDRDDLSAALGQSKSQQQNTQFVVLLPVFKR